VGQGKRFPLVFNQHFTVKLDNWDPAVLDGLAREREVIIFNNTGVASSTGEVPTSFAGMAKNAEAFIDGLGLTRVDLLGFSIGGMVAQQIILDRPELVRKLILVGTAPRNHDAGNGKGTLRRRPPRSLARPTTHPRIYGSRSFLPILRRAKPQVASS
jgi:pimeloyl-ACP methyl ester carboxylesterase